MPYIEFVLLRHDFIQKIKHRARTRQANALAGYTLLETLLAMSIAAALLIGATLATSGVLGIADQQNQALHTSELIYIARHLQRAVAHAGINHDPFAPSDVNSAVVFDDINQDAVLVLRTAVIDSGQRDCLNQIARSATVITTRYQFDASKLDGSIVCRSSLAARSDHVANHVQAWQVRYLRLTTTSGSEPSVRVLPLTRPPALLHERLVALTHHVTFDAVPSLRFHHMTARSLNATMTIRTATQ